MRMGYLPEKKTVSQFDLKGRFARQYLSFAGKSSKDFLLYLSGPGVYDSPAADVESTSVPGRNGDIISENARAGRRRYQNVDIKYEAFFFNGLPAKTAAVKSWLLSPVGYQKLQDTYDPDFFRMAVCTEAMEFDVTAQKAAKMDLVFNCKPQRWSVEGQRTVRLESRSNLMNPFAFPSQPVFKVYGDSGGVLYVGDESITIHSIKDYGYRKTKDGEIVIEPDEAAIVRMIFKMYQYGIPMTDILDELTFIQAPSARGKQTWNKTALKYLLENEKYIGDMRLQKWVSVDHISHRSVRNDSTVIPVYNVRNHHVPIIDRHTYQQVQRIMELKSPHGEYSRYPYFDTNIVCPLCGKKMIPRVMKVNSHKRILGCFDVDGCRGYAVKGYLVDAALLEAYNTLEIKEKKRTVAMQRMLEIKAESPKLDTVQYYWLDDLVGHIEFKQDTMRVFWKCGLESEVALNASKVEEPTHVAELYRNSLDRAQRSENKPVSVVRADKKSVNTREAQRNAAMQTAKNLRAKENGVAANDY